MLSLLVILDRFFMVVGVFFLHFVEDLVKLIDGFQHYSIQRHILNSNKTEVLFVILSNLFKVIIRGMYSHFIQDFQSCHWGNVYAIFCDLMIAFRLNFLFYSLTL